jgi:hypothetical protein
LLGNGDGTFQSPRNTDVVGPVVSLAAADLNRDGKTDLLFAPLIKGVGVLLGNGDGTFQSPQYLTPARGNIAFSVATRDFNGDGKPDLFLANHEFCLSGSCSFYGAGLFLGNGDGTFQGPTATTTVNNAFYNDTSSSATADFDLDGHMDAAFVSFDGVSGTVSVWPGNGNGTFRDTNDDPSRCTTSHLLSGSGF